MRTIAEISKETGLTKQAVYKRVNQPSVKQYLSKVERVTYLSDEGFRMAFSDFDPERVKPQVEPIESVKTLYETLIEQQKAELGRAHAELDKKNEHITNLTRMLDQSQILQKQLMDQVQLLSAPKETPVEEDVPVHQPSFWDKLRGRR